MKQALSALAAVHTLGGRGRGPPFHWSDFTMCVTALPGPAGHAPLDHPSFAGMDIIAGHLT